MTTNTGPELARPSAADQVETQLMERMSTFIAVAPPCLGNDDAGKTASIKRLVRQASIAVAKNPKLAECRPSSIALSVLQAVELGLDLASAMPMAWLVPYGAEAKLMVSYRGLCAIAYREGAVTLIQSLIVHEMDDFEVDYGNVRQPWKHRPPKKGDRGPVIGAYAYAMMKGSDIPAFLYMPIEELEKVRMASKSKDSGAWDGPFRNEMYRKCPVRRLFKMLPLVPPALVHAFEIDQQNDGLEERTPAPSISNRAKLDELLSTKPEVVADSAPPQYNPDTPITVDTLGF